MQLPIFAFSGPKDWALVALAALILALLPVVFDDPFFILVMQSLAYLFIVTLGLDILVGWTGQISLGHAGLYAVGAYTTPLPSPRLAFPFFLAATLVGVNVYRYKALAFVISSVYAGIGGVFFAHQNGFINSDTFVFSLSVSLLTSALMGGSGTLFGPLVGSVILNLIPTVFASLHDYHLYIYGGIILVTIVFLPRGIVGRLQQMPALRPF